MLSSSRRFSPLILLSAFVISVSCGPSVTVKRLAPAPYNLGPVRRLALVEAGGPSRRSTELVRERLIARIDQQGVFSIDDAVPARTDMLDFFEWLFSKEKASARTPIDPQEFRRLHPAEVYVRLRVTDIQTWKREKTKTKKEDGKDVVKYSYWGEAECSFQLTLVDGHDGTRLARFSTTKRATSPIYDEWRDSLRLTAEKSAVETSVDDALEQFTPRHVTDVLSLDDKAPRAAEGIELIKAENLREARALWEKAAKENPGSAGLAYNLGCVSEALGDSKAAAEWYEDAIRLEPSERNRNAAAALKRGLADAESLRRRD